MDPFTAVSLAGNILQFLIYAKDCCVEITEIQRSTRGLSVKNVRLLESTERMDELVDSVSAGTKALEQSRTTTEQRIRDAGLKCQQIALVIRQYVEGKVVKKGGGILQATASALSGSRKTSAIDMKLKEMENLRTHLFQLLLAHVRYTPGHFFFGPSLLGLLISLLVANSKVVLDAQ